MARRPTTRTPGDAETDVIENSCELGGAVWLTVDQHPGKIDWSVHETIHSVEPRTDVHARNDGIVERRAIASMRFQLPALTISSMAARRNAATCFSAGVPFSVGSQAFSSYPPGGAGRIVVCGDRSQAISPLKHMRGV